MTGRTAGTGKQDHGTTGRGKTGHRMTGHNETGHNETGHNKTGDATVALVWLRQDLRLSDHRPLLAAIERAGRVLPVFILDEQAAGPWAPGGAARWWLHHSLSALSVAFAERGTRLILRRGDSAAILAALACETGATSVQCGLAHEPWLAALDTRVADALAAENCSLDHHRVSTLFDLDAIRSRTGTRYAIYAPFARACRVLPEPAEPLDAPARVPGPDRMPESDAVSDWNLLPTAPDWAGGLRDTWTPGEAGARNRLDAFLDGRLENYGEARNLPGDPAGTSMLSPHLHWGEISPAQVWHGARNKGGGARGFETFRGEVLWHEFAAYLLRHDPHLPEAPQRAAFERLSWRTDSAALRAWQAGRTGVPIVDAGMRQLWRLGWMHNRARMITASWLCKHLLLSWQDGERWFWDTLVDADLATNAASWQWIAGTGTDCQPFFRIFNPVTQALKFDADGRYVRQYVPELARLPDRWLQRPWEAPAAVLKQAGVVLGRDYPRPTVALDEGRDRALRAYREQVRSARDEAA